MSIIKHSYELSVWDIKDNTEKKIAVIGSSTMSEENRAQEIILKRNINGTKELTFSLYTKFFDSQEGVVKDNPFYPLLVNNSRVKLHWKKNWYEFVIKTISEDSENKKISYVAEDAFINELSKRGFNIELSTDLENNQGTIIELGEKVLKNSGWSIDKKNSKVKPQFVSDGLVELTTTKSLTAKQKITIDSNELISISSASFKIPKNKKILAFYNNLVNESSDFQFYYSSDGNYKTNDSNFVTNCPIYIIENQKYKNQIPAGTKKDKVSNFQGKRLVKIQKSGFDNVLDKYVNFYKDSEDNIISGYSETEYLTSDSVVNLITNGKDFTSKTGWNSLFNDDEKIEMVFFPDTAEILNSLESEQDFILKTYLKTQFDYFDDWSFFNTGFDDNKYNLDGLQANQKFVIKIKYGWSSINSSIKYPKEPSYDKDTFVPHSCFKIGLCAYDYDGNGDIIITEELFSTSLDKNESNCFKKEGEYFSAICTNYSTYSKTELEEMNLGIFFGFEKNKRSVLNEDKLFSHSFYIEDCQFFEYKEKEEGGYYTPEDLVEGKSRKIYNYFYTDDNYSLPEEISYLYRGYEEQDYEKLFYEDYCQVRTIEAKESNYFNLIQSLCETFECWVDFKISHDNLGYITKDDDDNPIKQIVFKPYIGKENWSGFHQGINLKKILRTLNSQDIVTKTIVKANSNEFAPNGFCTIAYAEDNPSGENFIYDFSYYEQNNLINKEEINDYLYNNFYPNLKSINKKILNNSEEKTNAELELIHLNSDLEIKKASVSGLATEIADEKKNFKIYCGFDYLAFLELDKSEQEKFLESLDTAESFIKILRDTEKLKENQEAIKKLEKNIEKLKEKIEDLNLENETLVLEKENLILSFENKYSSFIHEGVWISEEYVDHNIYYIDAKNVAATSAKPQVTYNIDVIDLSCFEEFLPYSFDLGDKTYITDTEFFGYIVKNGIYTPRQQEVIITELSEDLDSPENNRITVQNYKTQFEDLFQRITAATQELKLREGEYARAANAFNSSGLDQEVVEYSINSSRNFNLTGNGVNWDLEGLVSTNLTNNHEFLKIQNGNLFLTSDGGKTWNTAINGNGINANYIYSGQIDAGKVNIVSELKTNENGNLEYALSLDKNGITMFSYKDKKIPRVRLGKIVTDDIYSEELYGLQLYDAEGNQTFKTDSEGNITMKGTIYAKDGTFSGTISASKGLIGGWTIDTNMLTHKKNGAVDAIISTEKLKSSYTVNSYSTNDWRLLFGIYGIGGNFGVTGSGNLYANGVDIKDGNISFGDIFKVTSNKTESDSGTNLGYGLSIQFPDETQDKEVVIESDDGVIGIREKSKDKNGNIVKDEDGKDKWIWRTVLGDLTNVTLGGKKVSELGLTGYGLCTDNGLFSGTIYSAAGKIGGWDILNNSLIRSFEKNGDDDTWIKKGLIIGFIPETMYETHIFSGDGDKTYTYTSNKLPPSGEDIREALFNENSLGYMIRSIIYAGKCEALYRKRQAAINNLFSVFENRNLKLGISSSGQIVSNIDLSTQNFLERDNEIISIYPNDFLGLFEEKETKEIKKNIDIVSIKNELNEFNVWKISNSFCYKEALTTGESNLEIGNYYDKSLSKWIFQQNEDKTYNFYFSGMGTEPEEKYFCSLGTEEHPWEKAYIKKLMIKNETSFKDSDNLLYAKKGNDSEVGGIYYEIDIANLDYFRIPKKGILPYYRYNKVPNNETNSTIGTANWYFENGYFNKITVGGKVYSKRLLEIEQKTKDEVGGTYWGMDVETQAGFNILRTPLNGLIPYYKTGHKIIGADGKEQEITTNSNIGTDAWRFKNGYFENLYTTNLNGINAVPYKIGDTINLQELFLSGFSWDKVGEENLSPIGRTFYFSFRLDKPVKDGLGVKLVNSSKKGVINNPNSTDKIAIYASGMIRFPLDKKYTDIMGGTLLGICYKNYINFRLEIRSGIAADGGSTGVSTGIYINNLDLQFVNSDDLIS